MCRVIGVGPIDGSESVVVGMVFDRGQETEEGVHGHDVGFETIGASKDSFFFGFVLQRVGESYVGMGRGQGSFFGGVASVVGLTGDGGFSGVDGSGGSEGRSWFGGRWVGASVVGGRRVGSSTSTIPKEMGCDRSKPTRWSDSHAFFYGEAHLFVVVGCDVSTFLAVGVDVGVDFVRFVVNAQKQ